MTLWTLAIVIALVIAALLALRFAISQNGAAVLNTVDRITGGARDVELAERASFGEADAQKLLIYRSTTQAAPDAQLPVILFAHGGSWRWGDPDDYTFIARSLAPEGFVVVLAGYRLHPQAKYPAMLEDTASAIAWTQANIAKHGGDPSRIILAGHSAGAYNVVMTALEPKWLEQEGLSTDAIAGVVGLSGPYDFFPFDSDSTINSFGDAADPEATQPINAVRGDAAPMLFIHGEADTLVYPRNSRRLAEAITEAGGSASAELFPVMEHSQPLMAFASPYRKDPAIVDLVLDFARRLDAPETAAEEASVPIQGETG